ncbi:hypothetical protein ABNP43_00920 [Bacillus altitudinis]|uniref:hypothetical protein n=1 Tax=Bacillus altitudinis TaxID=293387 RepID=UPI0032EBDFF0
MKNIKLVLQKQIGNRIRNYRKYVKGLKQEDFSAQYQTDYGYMEVSILSYIERGKIKGRNTSYLTNAQINDFSSMMKCSIKELIFGNEGERINLVKLVLLRIIVNGSKSSKEGTLLNPIINVNQWNEDLEEFLRLAMLNITDPNLQRRVTTAYFHANSKSRQLEAKGIIKECIKWYEKNYAYFADPRIYGDMNSMLDYHDSKLEKASNLLVNLLFSDIHFATDFITGIERLSQLKNNQIEIINKFRRNEGQFGDIAIDWKEVSYSKFIKAFNYMWSRNETKIMDYFDKEIFSRVSSDSSLKDFDESFFENAIVSGDFNDLLYTLLNDEKYNLQTMLGHNIVSTTLQTMIIESNTNIREWFQEGYNIFKYNYDIHQISQALIDFNENKLDRNLHLYINQLIDKKL